MRPGDMRPAPLEPAVEPGAILAWIDGQDLDLAAHAEAPFAPSRVSRRGWIMGAAYTVARAMRMASVDAAHLAGPGKTAQA